MGGAISYAATTGGQSPRQREPSHRNRKESTITSRVFVGNLSFDSTQGELENMFSEVGRVVEVFLPSDRVTGRPRGFAFVEFADSAAAGEAIRRFNEREFKGRNLRVTEAEERQPRAPRWLTEEASFGGGHHGDRPKPKGSRRGLRGKKRSLF
jgi:RNA recognition motif-containing protein